MFISSPKEDTDFPVSLILQSFSSGNGTVPGSVAGALGDPQRPPPPHGTPIPLEKNLKEHS